MFLLNVMIVLILITIIFFLHEPTHRFCRILLFSVPLSNAAAIVTK